jgi:hypothetical protein
MLVLGKKLANGTIIGYILPDLSIEFLKALKKRKKNSN